VTAKDSPVAPVKQEDVPSFTEILGQTNGFSLGYIKGHIRKHISIVGDLRVGTRHEKPPDVRLHYIRIMANIKGGLILPGRMK